MTSGQNLPIKFAETVEFTIPPLMHRPEVYLSFTHIREGESRLREAQLVNPATYAELEFTYGEGYREAKKNLSLVGYEIMQAEKMIRKLKSEYLIDEYPDFLSNSKLKDSNATKDAFLTKKDDYVQAVDRLDSLKALESLLEGKVKVFENVSRYMKKQMDILIRSGIDPNKY